MSAAFDNHALAALRAHAAAWHCMLCWAREANLNRGRAWTGPRSGARMAP